MASQATLYALDAATGTQQWQQTAPQVDDNLMLPVLVTGNSVYFSPDSLHIVKMAMSDGSMQGMFAATSLMNTWAVDAHQLYIATLSGVYAYQVTDDTAHWHVNVAQVLNLVVADGTLLTLRWDGDSHATTTGTYIAALQTTDGSQSWQTHVDGHPEYFIAVGVL